MIQFPPDPAQWDEQAANGKLKKYIVTSLCYKLGRDRNRKKGKGVRKVQSNLCSFIAAEIWNCCTRKKNSNQEGT